MTEEIIIRNYHPGDLEPLVDLINESDAVDKQERGVTLAEMEHRLGFPNRHPETDCFLAWDGDRLVGWSDMFLRPGDGRVDHSIYNWGVVHPGWRRRGLGRQLLERAYHRATDYLPQLGAGRVNFFAYTGDGEHGRRALFEAFGLEPVRYWLDLERSLDGDLPPVELPAGVRLRAFDPQRDVEEVWRVDSLAFRDHWNHAEASLEEFQHWVAGPNLRPELWFLAEEEETDRIVGLGLNEISPDHIGRTGRQEGLIDTLGVLRSHRRRGLGTALLVQCLHALKQAGMDMAFLDADAENPTGAVRLYERVGFQVRRTRIFYRKAMREE